MIYIASPYSHKDPVVMERRFQEAARYAAELRRENQQFFCPITMCHPLVPHGVPTDAASWWEFNRRYLDLSTELHALCLRGWEKSSGMQQEIEYMKGQGKPVQYVQPVSTYLAHDTLHDHQMVSNALALTNEELEMWTKRAI